MSRAALAAGLCALALPDTWGALALLSLLRARARARAAAAHPSPTP